ncbi:COP9 signalosome complex subunit 7 [Hibiscus syriacus]|uniref:COP9 signalosome complex subunit 7 n=1 Tax=Hibiscus syriacus TaxID=106335 RepID=A0A6A2ZLL4_HIBSY|nr:COP9 signalosome complex subunit 7 [Hibiscus syriacus]
MDIEQKQAEFIDHFIKQASAQKGTTLVSVIVEVTSHPSLFAFSEILTMPTVAELDRTENSMYLEVLRLFAHSTWSDYKSNSGSLPQLVPDQVLKLKQLTVLTLAETNKLFLQLFELSFGGQTQYLRSYSGSAFTKGIVRGKLDQLRRCFEIQFAAGRDLRPGQLGSMIKTLSNWYLDMLPTTFGNPLWFTDDEMLELRGTILYRAAELRKKDLISVYEDKMKGLVKKFLALDGVSERDLLKMNSFLFSLKMGTNSIFWSRALNLPLPHSYVFPQIQEDTETTCPVERSSEVTISHSGLSGEPINEIDGKGFEGHENDNKVNGATSTSKQEETIWVEGLLPSIDFCNHDLNAVATWEVPIPKLIDIQRANNRFIGSKSKKPAAFGSNKEWKPKVINSNFRKGSGTTCAFDVPTSSVEANAHSQPVSRVLDSEEATSKLQKKLEELHLRSYNM